MTTATAAPVQLINVQINGSWMQFPKGTRVIEACRQAGVFVPHYCYHPKLSSPGNCRMCLVEMGMPKMAPDRTPEKGEDGHPVINWIPRPQISCAQEVSEGMGVRTDSPMAEEARKGVMEFLLINHPLDCPICDQAGECKLQEFSVEYGNAGSRFREEKVRKPKNVAIGPRITLDDERCILCSRCVRFMQEVAKDDVLGFVQRGSFNTLTVHPGRQLDSNYSLNTVDICPVGALTSSDFRFKMRVWFLKETKSFCTSCATGCNTIIGSRDNVVYRQTPRDNPYVNDCWMCDFGRLDIGHLSGNDRLREPLVIGSKRKPTHAVAIAKAAESLKAAAGVAMIVSGRLTNEELFLAKRLGEALGVQHMDLLPRLHEADGILMSADRNPNTAGAILLGLTGPRPGERLEKMAAGIREGTIKGLLVLGENPLECGLTKADLERLDAFVVTTILKNESTEMATVAFPSAATQEKRGSMVNGKRRLQRLNRAVQPPDGVIDDWETLRDLITAISGSNGLHGIEDVFKQLAASIPLLNGLSLAKIGDLGVDLSQRENIPAATG